MIAVWSFFFLFTGTTDRYAMRESLCGGGGSVVGLDSSLGDLACGGGAMAMRFSCVG